jgi:hypothetical protein
MCEAADASALVHTAEIFTTSVVDGGLGMAYGVLTNTALLAIGLPPARSGNETTASPRIEFVRMQRLSRSRALRGGIAFELSARAGSGKLYLLKIARVLTRTERVSSRPAARAACCNPRRISSRFS